MENFKEHALVSGSEILSEMVTEVTKNEDFFVVKTSSGKIFESKKVILAT
jgi:hypothetical protein